MNSDKSTKPNVSELRSTINNIKLIIVSIDKKQIFGQKNRENYFFENHPDIMDKYPFLVSQLVSGDNSNMLEIMLTQMEEIEKGRKSTYDAEVVIGQIITDQYIKK